MSKNRFENPTPETEVTENVTENSTEEKKFVNPFEKGVTYKDFINALGEQKIQDYCGDRLSITEIAWLEIEIQHFKNK